MEYKNKKNKSVAGYTGAVLLSILPLRLISRITGWIVSVKIGNTLLNKILAPFSRSYKVNIDEVKMPLSAFTSFNDFFYREIRDDARKVASGKGQIVSPVDGTILSFGSIENDTVIEAKGCGSKIDELVMRPGIAKKFRNGSFIVIYLSPGDYHRIHSPCTADITGYSHLPGRLYPVNSFAVNNIDRLFSKNERVITFFETNYRVSALIKVGATNVGSIRLKYKPELKTNRMNQDEPIHENFVKPISIKAGDELGRFELGSTVILLFEKDMVQLDPLTQYAKIRFGESLGKLI